MKPVSVWNIRITGDSRFGMERENGGYSITRTEPPLKGFS